MIKITKISVIIVIFYVLMYVQTWGDNHRLFYGASLLTVCSLAAYWIHERQVDLSCVPYGIWNNFIMVIYSVITGIFVAYNYSESIDSCITYAAFSVICVAICYISAKEGSIEWIYNVLIVLAFTCAIYMLTNGKAWKGYGRTLSPYNNPHMFAAVMNLGIFATAYKCRRHDAKEAVIAGFIILFFLYCIVECGSRKYLIASAFIVGIWGITQSTSIWKKKDTNQRILLVFIIILIIGLSTLYIRNIYGNSLISSRMNESNDEGNINRIKFYQYAVEIFNAHPVFGGGYDQFKFWAGTGGYAHSTYAEAIADFGFVGCLLYFIPILYATYQIIKTSLYNRDYKSSLFLAFCIAELFIGVGQIFFIEFHHFIAWTILFYYVHEARTKQADDSGNNTKVYKYIR